MSTLSSLMVEAARTHDWDRLVGLERSVSSLREILIAEDDNASLSVAEVERKRSLIQRILQDDAEIRRHTEPWMEHVRKFLGGETMRKNVERAYSTGR
ncbi:hypothetical protein CBW56_02325 [Denitratisoma oestradiolicum]|nr:hypothetical protein CBW56_02325 [Denitratisoma oestradiolicum]